MASYTGARRSDSPAPPTRRVFAMTATCPASATIVSWNRPRLQQPTASSGGRARRWPTLCQFVTAHRHVSPPSLKKRRRRDCKDRCQIACTASRTGLRSTGSWLTATRRATAHDPALDHGLAVDAMARASEQHDHLDDLQAGGLSEGSPTTRRRRPAQRRTRKFAVTGDRTRPARPEGNDRAPRAAPERAPGGTREVRPTQRKH